jgi:hypothetical protein
VPLLVLGQVFGVLEFASLKPLERGFTDNDRNLLFVMGAVIAELIENDIRAQAAMRATQQTSIVRPGDAANI